MKKKMSHSFYKNINKQKLFSKLTIQIIINNWAPIITDNNWAPNQHIRMIYEGSCDTEDWT